MTADDLMVEPIRIPPTPSLRKWSEANGFSPELVARWAEFYPDIKSLLASLQSPARTYLRCNGLRGPPRETIRRLAEKGFELAPTPLAGAYEVRAAPFSIGATEEYLLGRYYLQDLSSLLAPAALEPERGDRIADLAAAPGGKTIMLADLVANDASIFAFEPDASRSRSLESNLNRCGVRCAAIYASPGQAAAQLGLAFDRVLLDAPCTGEGVIQRDPHRRRGHLGEYAECARIQADLLRTAFDILRPGGVLVYSTCTLAPEENELQIQRVLDAGWFDLEALPPPLARAAFGGQALFPGLTRAGGRKLDERIVRTAHALPHMHGTQGFYVARLRKRPAA